MNQVAITPVLRWVGSMICDPANNKKGWWPEHSLVIEDTELIDAELKVVYNAVVSVNLAGIEPTIDAITEEIMLRGEISVAMTTAEEEQELFRKVRMGVADVCARGVTSKAELMRIEGMMRDFIMNQGVDKILPMIESMKKKNTPANDVVTKLMNYLERIDGSVINDEDFSHWEQQKELLQTFADTQRAMLNKPIFGFPVCWNLHRLVDSINPGDIITIVGGTSDGKSSLSHQFAEDLASNGYRSLFCHLEDTLKMIMMRQCCRWTDATFSELKRGDPDRKMEVLAKIREGWRKKGGDITYTYIPSMPASRVVRLVRNALVEAKMQGNPYSIVFLDYAQLIDFDSEATNTSNRTNVANKFIRQMKSLAITNQCRICFVSQQTQGENGTHTKDTKELESQAQILLRIKRNWIKDEKDTESVTLFDQFYQSEQSNGNFVNVPVGNIDYKLGRVNQRSIFYKMLVDKNTNGTTGAEDGMFNWQTFSGESIDFHNHALLYPKIRTDIPTLKPISPENLAYARGTSEAFKEAWSLYKKND